MLANLMFTFCLGLLGFQEIFSVVIRTKRQTFNASDFQIDNAITMIDNECNCVRHYQCDSDNFLITDGSGIFEERIGDPKKRILCKGGTFEGEYVCCKPRPIKENLRETNTTEIVKTKKPPKCGTQLPTMDIRIFDGEDELTPTIGEFPWLAAIFREVTGPRRYGFHCSGSLIHPKVVLTANHAVKSAKPKQLRILLSGEIELKPYGENTVAETKVKEIIRHPEYNSGSLYNDVALLILEEPYNLVNRSHHINTICLNPNYSFANKRCIVAGWGKTASPQKESKVLKKVEVPIIEHKKCENLLKKTRLGNDFILDRSFMCAGGEPGKDACKGDGGSPLMCPSENGHSLYQAGIVAWGIGCGQKDVPGVYADVPVLYEWIKETLERKGIEL